MTTQAVDHLELNGQEYVICGLEGSLPGARAAGLSGNGYSTASYRGYCASYRCRDDHLTLTSLFVGLWCEPPLLAGAELAVRFTGGKLRLCEYHGMSVPCPRARRVLIAQGCDFPEFYVVRPHPAAYRTVLELELQESRLVRTLDHSGAMQRIRDELQAHGSDPERRGAKRPGARPSNSEFRGSGATPNEATGVTRAEGARPENSERRGAKRPGTRPSNWIGVAMSTGFSFTTPGLEEQPPLEDRDHEPGA